MHLSELFVRRPVMTILLMASLLFLGFVSYKVLPVSDLPSIEYPTIEVKTFYPGASPSTIADTITSPLERCFTTIDGIQMMASSSTLGQSIIVLQFDLAKGIDIAAQDVQAAINQATPNLPPDLPSFPTYQKTNPTVTPITFLSISSATLPPGEIYEYTYTLISQKLSMIDGVSDVVIYGEPSAVRVQVDPSYLAAHQIGIDEIAQAIVHANPQKPTGSLYGKNSEYIIDIDGQIKKADQYDEIVVRNHRQALLKIRTLGQSIDSVKNDKYSLSYITKKEQSPCVVIGVVKQSHANTIKVVDQVQEILREVRKDLPHALTITTLFDQSSWIQDSVNDVEFTLLIAVLLVVIVVLFYLGKWIDTIIPLIALPLSIFATFILMLLYGFNVDILSLLAITLSVGFLVDDAIVVLENINRHVEMGKSVWEATLEGAREISQTIIAMTLSLTAIFLPMVLMPGVMGRLFREFSITIITAVIISGFVSLTLTPMLCSRFLASQEERGKENWIEKLSNQLNNSLLAIYRRSLDWTFRHSLLTIATGILSFLMTLFLFFYLPTTFLPEDDLGFIQGFGIAADQTSPKKMIEYQNALSEAVRSNPSVEEIVAINSKPNSNQSLMFIRLKPISMRPSMDQVVEELLSQMNQVPGIKVFLRPVSLISLDVGTSASMGNYQYTLQGFLPETLYKSSEETIKEMEQSPFFRQVASNLHNRASYLKLTIDRDRAYDLGISPQSIEKTFQYAYSGGRLSLINGQNNQYYVIIETLPSAQADPRVLDQLYISTNRPNLSASDSPTSSSFPAQVPLSAVANWEEVTDLLEITHINTLPAVTISYDLPTDVPLSRALDHLKGISSKHLGYGVNSVAVGSAQAFSSSMKSLAILSILTLVVIYVILGILYENFTHPLTVMSALPPAALGGLLTLMLFHKPLSLYALIGMILLLGIVLKNGIMLIDFANTGIERGKSIREAIREACEKRLRPILMTTFSAMMGAVPIALGIGGLTAQSRRPLGMVVVGGLVISQILTLFFTPAIFIALENLRERFGKRKRKQEESSS